MVLRGGLELYPDLDGCTLHGTPCRVVDFNAEAYHARTVASEHRADDDAARRSATG
jgi:hypothetical protein